MLSARNQFPGQIKSLTLGNVMAEVVISVGDLEVVSAITRDSAQAMQLNVGDTVTAIIKSTEVMIQKDHVPQPPKTVTTRPEGTPRRRRKA
jgi:molybdopterin-binding protein